MPANYLMTWDARSRRWRKLHRGVRHVVSCRQLHAPETKEGSYRAANAWWTARRAEIEGRDMARSPHASEMETLGRQIEWASRHDPSLVPGLSQWGDTLRADTTGDLPPALSIPTEAGRWVWQDRMGRDGADPIPSDRSVGHQIDRWLETQVDRVRAGEITPARHNNARICLVHFRDFVGSGLPVERITEETWRDFHRVLLAKIAARLADPDGKDGWSRDYCHRLAGLARQFIKWLWEHGLIERLPKNLDSRTCRIEREVQAVPTMTVEEVRSLIEGATGQLQLHLLLMCNCGMTPVDIGDLRQEEIVEGGRVTRQRSKTRRHHGDDVPTVSYILWDRTADLLRRYRSSDPTFALLTTTGRRWVDKRWEGGKLVAKDAISTRYYRLVARVGGGPLKLIRKTSASLLETHPVYGRYVPHFLGHSPRSIADRHYRAPSGELFDEAIGWLGARYGY